MENWSGHLQSIMGHRSGVLAQTSISMTRLPNTLNSALPRVSSSHPVTWNQAMVVAPRSVASRPQSLDSPCSDYLLQCIRTTGRHPTCPQCRPQFHPHHRWNVPHWRSLSAPLPIPAAVAAPSPSRAREATWMPNLPPWSFPGSGYAGDLPRLALLLRPAPWNMTAWAPPAAAPGCQRGTSPCGFGGHRRRDPAVAARCLC